MPLIEHLRELRRRVFICIARAWSPASVLGWIFYDTLVQFLRRPDLRRRRQGLADGGTCGPLVINGLLGPFNLQVKVALARVSSSPARSGSTQLWAFVTPGLHRNERRWTRRLPRGAASRCSSPARVLLLDPAEGDQAAAGLHPRRQVGSIVDFNEFLSIVMRLMLVFGLAFEVPVFIVLLNLLGVLPAGSSPSWWRQIMLRHLPLRRRRDADRRPAHDDRPRRSRCAC